MRISDWSSDVCSSDLARQGLRRPLVEADVQAAPGVQARYTRTAQNEIYRQFHRLPNPDLVMYVFPHLAGTDPVPVPGYRSEERRVGKGVAVRVVLGGGRLLKQKKNTIPQTKKY